MVSCLGCRAGGSRVPTPKGHPDKKRGAGKSVIREARMRL